MLFRSLHGDLFHLPCPFAHLFPIPSYLPYPSLQYLPASCFASTHPSHPCSFPPCLMRLRLLSVGLPVCLFSLPCGFPPFLCCDAGCFQSACLSACFPCRPFQCCDSGCFQSACPSACFPCWPWLFSVSPPVGLLSLLRAAVCHQEWPSVPQ